MRPDTEEDARQRELAISERDRNVVVMAGAGSGKTSLLVSRALHLCLERGIPLSAMAAITFTEAAAAEMRMRIGAALAALRAGPLSGEPSEATRARERAEAVPTDVLRERAAEALRSLDRAAISTIHAFCQKLLRRHPAAAGVAPGATVDEPAAFQRRAAGDWPDALFELSRKPEEGPRLQRICRVMTVADLRRLFLCLVEPSSAPTLEASRADGSYAVATYLAALEKHGRADRERRLKALRKKLLAADDAAFRDALHLLAPYAAATRARIDHEGRQSFDALLFRACELLRAEPEIRRLEAARYRAILVDEFQDTDPLQYEIVLFLAEDPSSSGAEDPWRVKLAPGKLFVVGDSKQSIFRFRGADVAACQAAQSHILGQGALPVTLSRSFRSPAALLEPLHELFAPWLPPKDEEEAALGAAPPYEGIASARDAPDPTFGSAPRVEVWTVPAPASASERRRREAAFIAARIVEDVRRGLRPCDHAILLSAFGEVAVYARALSLRGVSFVLDGGRTFYERPEVTDLLAILRAITEPNDEVALLAALRSSVGAVPDAELARHADAGGRLLLGAEVDQAATPSLSAALSLLRGLASRAAFLPADEAVRHVLAATRLPEIHAAGYDGAQRVANLGKLRALANDLGCREGLSLSELASELTSRVRAREEEGEQGVGDEDESAVPILTIHRAKGREFPIVFVADMAREKGRRSGNGVELRVVTIGGTRLLAASVPDGKRRTQGSVLRTDLEKVHEAAEDRRKLYVACTRARERLCLLAAERSRASWIRALSAWGYDAASPPADGALLADRRVAHRLLSGEAPRDALAPPPSVDFVAAARRQLEARATVRARAPIASPTRLREERESRKARDAGPLDSARDRPRLPEGLPRPVAFAIGTAVHAVLEHADFQDPASIVDARTVAAAALRAARSHGVDGDLVEPPARAILERFSGGALRARLAKARVLARELPMLLASDLQHGGQHSPPLEVALSKAAQPLALPLAAASGRAVLLAPEDDAGPASMSGVADILFREVGQLVVADWKTDPLPEDEEVITRTTDFYRSQVEWYAMAIGRALGRKVWPEIFYLTLDRAVRL